MQISLTSKQKAWIRRRDENQCQLCRGKGTQCHHIVPISEAKKMRWEIARVNSPYNVILLCDNCHKLVMLCNSCDDDNILNIDELLSKVAEINTKKYEGKHPKDTFPF